MIKFVGKTTRGSAVPRNLFSFSQILSKAYDRLATTDPIAPGEWRNDSLDHLANKTLFQTIFNSIFGADKECSDFNYELFHDNFRVFHKYFSYLWLGLPHFLFPEATKAVGNLFTQPTPEEFMKSSDTSEYLKAAIEYLKSYNLPDSDIKCHNLVFMHININTFKIAFWCMYELMANPAAMRDMRTEMNNLLEANAEQQDADDQDVIGISAKDLEGMKVLGE